jgi:hypothetical protein
MCVVGKMEWSQTAGESHLIYFNYCIVSTLLWKHGVSTNTRKSVLKYYLFFMTNGLPSFYKARWRQDEITLYDQQKRNISKWFNVILRG